MSNKAISWAYDQQTGSPARKAVLLVLADDANSDGLCFRGQTTIADRTELHRVTVNKALKDLEEMGFVSTRQRRRKNGSRTSNEYQLHLDKVAQDNIAEVADDNNGNVASSNEAPPEQGSPEQHPEPPLNPGPPRNLAANAAEGHDQNQKPAAKKERPRDLHWEMLVLELGITDPMSITESARGAMNKALAAIKKTGANPGDIRARAREYRKRFPDAPLTAPALAKQWPILVPTKGRYQSSTDDRPPECEHDVPLKAVCEECGRETFDDVVAAYTARGLEPPERAA